MHAHNLDRHNGLREMARSSIASEIPPVQEAIAQLDLGFAAPGNVYKGHAR
jgi:hypothetical protein